MFQAYNDFALVRDVNGPSLRTFGLDWPPQQRIYGGQSVTIGRNLKKNIFERDTKFCSRHRCKIEIEYFDDMCMCLQEVYCYYSLEIFIYGAKFAYVFYIKRQNEYITYLVILLSNGKRFCHNRKLFDNRSKRGISD